MTDKNQGPGSAEVNFTKPASLQELSNAWYNNAGVIKGVQKLLMRSGVRLKGGTDGKFGESTQKYLAAYIEQATDCSIKDKKTDFAQAVRSIDTSHENWHALEDKIIDVMYSARLSGALPLAQEPAGSATPPKKAHRRDHSKIRQAHGVSRSMPHHQNTSHSQRHKRPLPE